jgi:hypothetical protein
LPDVFYSGNGCQDQRRSWPPGRVSSGFRRRPGRKFGTYDPLKEGKTVIADKGKTGGTRNRESLSRGIEYRNIDLEDLAMMVDFFEPEIRVINTTVIFMPEESMNIFFRSKDHPEQREEKDGKILFESHEKIFRRKDTIKNDSKQKFLPDRPSGKRHGVAGRRGCMIHEILFFLCDRFPITGN